MWNYRVVKVTVGGESVYGVHEVHYRDDTDDQPHSWTEAAVSPRGETRAEVHADLGRWLSAFAKPVLVSDGQTFTGDTEPSVLPHA